MASLKERICVMCRTSELTFSKAKKCAKCSNIEKVQKAIDREKEYLAEHQYSSIEYTHENVHGKRSYKVVTPCCGHTCNMLFGNIRAMVSKYGKPPCPNCGGKERVVKALNSYIEAYGRTYDLTLFEDYAAKVRCITENTYRTYKQIINPDDKIRGVNYKVDTYQLDHKMSIRDCFVHSIPIELAGSLLNLTFIPSLENTSKGKKSSIDLRKWIGKNLQEYEPGYLATCFDVDINLEDPPNPAEHIRGYLASSKDSMVAYIDRKVLESAKPRIDKMRSYGFTNIQFISHGVRDGRLSKPQHVFSITHGDRTEVLEYSKILILMKNGLFLWPSGSSYYEYIKSITVDKQRKRVISDAERQRRSMSKRGIKLSDEAKAKLAMSKRGRKRWYHENCDAFKQSVECPGDGWTLTKAKA